MLGFDAYTKSSFGAILEQRIRIFFSKRYFLNFPLILTAKSTGNSSEIDIIVNETFKTFKKDLEDKKIYYHYAVSSLLLENPDYDFLTNSEQDIVELANQSILEIYSKTVKNILGAYNEKEPPPENEELFSYLKNKIYHRIIPDYHLNEGGFKSDLLNCVNELSSPFQAPGSKAANAATQEVKEANEENRFKLPTADKFGIQVGISKIPSPFYIEYFWRMAPIEKQGGSGVAPTTGDLFSSLMTGLSEYKFFNDGNSSPLASFEDLRSKYFYSGFRERRRYQYTNLSSVNGAVTLLPKLNNKFYYFQRGVRLMYNLTAFIEERDVTKKINSSHIFHQILTQAQLPFLNVNRYQKVPVGELDPYPLPFLTDEYLEKTSFFLNFYYKMARSDTPGKIKAIQGKRGDPTALENSLYFTDKYGTESGGKTFDVNKNFYWAYDKIKDKFKYIDFFKMKNSKSLISFELDEYVDNNITKQYLNGYFPIILAEQVSPDLVEPNETVNIDKFNELVEKMLSDNSQVKFLKSIYNYEEIKKRFLNTGNNPLALNTQKFLENSEKNLKILNENQISAKQQEEIYNSTPDIIKPFIFPDGLKYDKLPFFDTTETENSLDNLLLSLINFDEET